MQQKSARGATIKNATLTMSQMGLHAGNGSYCVEEEELIEWEILLRVSNDLKVEDAVRRRFLSFPTTTS